MTAAPEADGPSRADFWAAHQEAAEELESACAWGCYLVAALHPRQAGAGLLEALRRRGWELLQIQPGDEYSAIGVKPVRLWFRRQPTEADQGGLP